MYRSNNTRIEHCKNSHDPMIAIWSLAISVFIDNTWSHLCWECSSSRPHFLCKSLNKSMIVSLIDKMRWLFFYSDDVITLFTKDMRNWRIPKVILRSVLWCPSRACIEVKPSTLVFLVKHVALQKSWAKRGKYMEHGTSYECHNKLKCPNKEDA